MSTGWDWTPMDPEMRDREKNSSVTIGEFIAGKADRLRQEWWQEIENEIKTKTKIAILPICSSVDEKHMKQH